MLESLYFVCAGPILVIVALIGLRQISAVREQTERSEEQHRRVLAMEADRRAVDLCDRYLTELVPDLRRIQGRLAQLHRDWGDTLRSGPKFDWDDVLPDARDRMKFGTQLTLLVRAEDAADVLNQLESMALQFNCGVASDRLGRSLLQDTLLEAVRLLWPHLAKSRIESPGAYGELIRLYERWSCPPKQKPTPGHG